MSARRRVDPKRTSESNPVDPRTLTTAVAEQAEIEDGLAHAEMLQMAAINAVNEVFA